MHKVGGGPVPIGEINDTALTPDGETLPATSSCRCGGSLPSLCPNETEALP